MSQKRQAHSLPPHLNCSKRFFGRKVHGVYLVLATRFAGIPAWCAEVLWLDWTQRRVCTGTWPRPLKACISLRRRPIVDV